MPKSHVFGRATGLGKQLRTYFETDLQQIPNMTDQQLGELADRAADMKRLMEVLPIVEQHLETLITGQVQYEEFISRTLKAADKAGRKIDKLTLDSFLLNRGYTKHLDNMKQQAALETKLQDAEYLSAATLDRMDFQAALQLVKMKHLQKAQQIQQRIPDAKQQALRSDQEREASQRRRELITRGTKGTKFDRLKNFMGLGG